MRRSTGRGRGQGPADSHGRTTSKLLASYLPLLRAQEIDHLGVLWDDQGVKVLFEPLAAADELNADILCRATCVFSREVDDHAVSQNR